MDPHSVFNDLDYVVIGVVLLSGLLALMRGFVRELFSLVAWTGAFFAATKFYAPAVPMVKRYIKNDQAAEWAAMACVFIVALIVLMIIGHFVCRLIKGRALTSIDCSLGFLYGLARGTLVISLLYMSAGMIFWPDLDAPAAEQQLNKDTNPPPDILLHAKTRPFMAFGADMLKVLVPKEMIDKTLKDAEAKKEAMEKSAREKALDAVQTSTSATSDADNSSPLNVNKLFNQDSKP